MICAGPSGTFPNGFPKVNGAVKGFMQVIGAAAAHSIVLELFPD